MLPNGWQACNSTAVEAFRFVAARDILQVVFVESRMMYDYPCTDLMYARFAGASSKGRFVNEVLKPYAELRGWSSHPRSWSSW